jgi:proton-coupled amino acid transporter
MNSLIEQQAYLDKRKYGGNKDGEVDSDDEKKYANDPDIMNKTPITKKKMIEEKETSHIKKLGPVQTYLTLMKGFVCVGVLYVPSAFINGGWGVTMLFLLVSAICTCYCSHLLLDARAAAKAESYTALGKIAYGFTGEMLVNLAVASSQMGFVIAFVYFIKANLHEIAEQAWGKDINVNWFFLG